jgi:flagellar hook assembly protein FlgD
MTFEGWYIDDVYFVNSTGGGDTSIVPLITELKGNYPNPFNPTTTISFSISEESNVAIDIFNVKGQKVKTLLNESKNVGEHLVHWNGTDEQNKSVSSGVYFYKMKAGKFVQTKKMILMK